MIIMASNQISITLPDNVYAAMEGARGDVSRSIYIRRAVERRLVDEGHLPPLPVAGAKVKARVHIPRNGSKRRT
jgi:hypothetical protein